MRKVQIFLPGPMMFWLKEKSEKKDVSVAELIRSILEKQVDEYDKKEKEKTCG